MARPVWGYLPEFGMTGLQTAALSVCLTFASAPASAEIIVQSVTATDVVTLTLAAPPSAADMQSLVVILDEIDVSYATILAGDQLIVTPGVPLTQGAHRIALFSDTGGALVPIGSWSVVVGRPAPGSSGELRFSLGAASTENGSETFGKIEADFALTTQLGSWDLTFEADGALSTLENPVEQYENSIRALLTLSRQAGDWQQRFRLGDHGLGYDPFLMPTYDRRGLSFDLTRSDDAVALAAFAMQTIDIPSELDDFGESLAVFGGVGARFQLGNIGFSTAAIWGEGAPYEGEPDGEGTGVSFRAGWSSPSGLTRLSTALALTRFDRDADGLAFEPETGRAFELRGEHDLLLPDGLDAPGLTLTWRIGQIDENFTSLANPGYGGDSRDAAIGLLYERGGLSVNAEIAHEVDNVLDNPNLPTDQSTRLSMDGYYDPGYGPEFTFGLSAERYRQVDTPNPFVYPALDADRYFATFGVANYDTLITWSVAQSVDRVEPRTAFAVGSTTYTTDLWLGYTPDDRTSFEGYVQYVDSEDDVLGAYDYTTIGLVLDHAFVNGPLLTASYDNALSSDGSFDGEDMRMALSWGLSDRTEMTVFAGTSSGDFRSDAPFGGGGYAGLSLTLKSPF